MLAEPGDPLILADGTKISSSTGKVIKERRRFVEVPTNTKAVTQVTALRRRLADLPEVPEKMHVISAVLTYSLFGLSRNEVALATRLTSRQVEAIQSSDAYSKLREAIIASIMAQDGDLIRGKFRENALVAADKIGELIDSDNEAVALAAAKDSLDRSGYRPADIVEHRHKMEGGLRIEFVSKSSIDDMPVLNLDLDATLIDVEEDNGSGS